MSKAPAFSIQSGQARSSTLPVDRHWIIALVVFIYVFIVSPFISFVSSRGMTLPGMMESQWDNRIFWPVATATSIGLTVLHLSRGGRLALPAHIIFLLAYLALAGASVSWAFRPELSFIRFVQQMMIITS